MARDPVIYETYKSRILKMLENGKLREMALGADSDKELYEALGMKKYLWFKLKNDIPELKQLIFNTRTETFLAIKGAMKKRAFGYEYEEVEDEEGTDPKTGMPYTKHKTTIKHCPPDLRSQMLIVANLKKAAAKDCEDNMTGLADWTNNIEEIEIQNNTTVSLVVDQAIQNVLKEITDDR